MKQSVSITPPYSQVVICDPTARVEVPLWTEGVPFVASDTYILLMCYPEVDGPTELVFGSGEEVYDSAAPIFEGRLKTPGSRIAVETVEADGIFSMATKGTETLVRV
jgi:hypothetical protein